MSARIVIRKDGTIVGIYSDEIPFREIAAQLGGGLSIKRASHVEPRDDGRWEADLSPSQGPMLGPFDLRQQALAAEVEWLRDNMTGAGS